MRPKSECADNPVSTPRYLLDKARRRLLPTVTNMAGMYTLEKWLLDWDWKQIMLAEPPAGSTHAGSSADPVCGAASARCRRLVGAGARASDWRTARRHRRL